MEITKRQLQDEELNAYHGSPHSFDKFSTQHMGTGEGAQAFGWGLYFTELEDIADRYAKIKQNVEEIADYLYDRTYTIKDVESIEKMSNAELKEKIIQRYENLIKEINNDNIENLDFKKHLIDTQLILKNRYLDYISKSNPTKYKVTLHKGKTPEQYNWLEWDRQVSNNIFDKIDKQAKLNGNIMLEMIAKDFNRRNQNGENVYKNISKILNSDKEASLFLLRSGIDGIKYPAESIARGATSDTARGFNYVVFDENAVNIEKQTQFEGMEITKRQLQESYGRVPEQIREQAIDFVFNEYPKLSSIGTKEDYNDYLNEYVFIHTNLKLILFKGLTGKKIKPIHVIPDAKFYSDSSFIAKRYYDSDNKGVLCLVVFTNNIDSYEVTDGNVPISKYRQLESDYINSSNSDVIILSTNDIGGKQKQYVVKDNSYKLFLGTDVDMEHFQKYLDLKKPKEITKGELEEAKKKKADRCTRIAKSKYDVWPSAYASGAVVKCRQGKIWKGLNEEDEYGIVGVEQLEKKLLDKYKGLKTLFLSKYKGALSVDMIEVNPNERSKGVGSNVMNDIIEYADANNMEIRLNPALKDERKGTTSRNRLVNFYKNFGFIENTGRNIDYTKKAGTMYRLPKSVGQSLNEKTDFSKEKEQGLHGWFARQGGKGKSKGWVDCNTCRDGKCKSCGRKEGESRSKYPACRPTPSACKSKGKGDSWGKKS